MDPGTKPRVAGASDGPNVPLAEEEDEDYDIESKDRFLETIGINVVQTSLQTAHSELASMKLSSSPTIQYEDIQAGSKQEEFENTESEHSHTSLNSSTGNSSFLKASPPGDILRSVSFNDKLLPANKKRNKSNSPFRRQSDTPSPPIDLQDQHIRRLASTPGCLHHIVKGQTLSTEEIPSPPTRSPQNRRSFKSMTTSLAGRFSFKKTEKSKSIPSFESSYNGLRAPGQGIVSYEALVRLFECPGCGALMFPPLLQCKKGHLVCEKCRSNLKLTCPVCQQRIGDTSNYMMEQVCNLVMFPCRFGKYGCPDYLPPYEKSQHEPFCEYRPINCHYESEGCDVVVPLQEMTTHLVECPYRTSRDKNEIDTK